MSRSGSSLCAGMTKAVRLTTVAEPGSLTPDGPRETGSRPARFSTKPIVAFQKESDIHPNVGTKRLRMTSSSAVRPPARTISSIIAVPRTAVPATAPKKTPLRERRNGMRNGDCAGVTASPSRSDRRDQVTQNPRNPRVDPAPVKALAEGRQCEERGPDQACRGGLRSGFELHVCITFV